nr:MAG TPA: hypothetical protein [Caudoviricetes sp.]
MWAYLQSDFSELILLLKGSEMSRYLDGNH